MATQSPPALPGPTDPSVPSVTPASPGTLINIVDLTAEAPAELLRTSPERRPLDPEPQGERMGGWIVLILLGMLAAVLICSFISLWKKIPTDQLQMVLTIIVGPLVALVSAATGFYFCSSATAERPPARP